MNMKTMYISYFTTALLFYVCHAISPTVVHRQKLWISEKQGEIHTYRTPIIVTLPTGDILAFSAPRKYTGADKSAKLIALRRSTDGGLNWDPTSFIQDDYVVDDGLNLGSVIIDYDTNTTFVIYGYCQHTLGNCTSPYMSKGVYYKKSTDWGYSWTQPINVGDTNPLLTGLSWAPGPGFGIQKRLAPNTGRLIGCGHVIGKIIRQMQCLYSDDHGETWHINKPVYGLPYSQPKKDGDFTPGETQVIELSNGTLLVAMRNQLFYHCRCRLQGLSFDGGMTFPLPYITVKESLVDPAVCASLALVNNTLFLSHTFNAKERINMTLHWSDDFGQTWPHAMQLYSKSSEYSCLTKINQDNIGILFERDDYSLIEFYKIRLK